MFEAWLLMALVIGFLFFSSLILSWVNFFTLRKLKRAVAELEALKNHVTLKPVDEGKREPSSDISSTLVDGVETESASDHQDALFPDDPLIDTPIMASKVSADPWGATAKTAKPVREKEERKYKPTANQQASTHQSSWKNNWMVWLGGGCIALSGIFLARYSIEQGLLGPTARIVLGLLLGLGMLLGAEWLRRKLESSYSAVAALAGGAIVMLYSVTLAALHLYQLWPPFFVFALLALISLAAMVLAVWHGPILAWIGIAGAYAVPLLIGGGSSDLLPVLIYVLIVTSSSLVLQRYVQQNWLFNLTLTGVLVWWWLLQLSGQSLEWVGLFLSVSAYLFLTIPQFNF
ncbi:MAG: DUF2339 domain-containing protein [Nitrincola sp.]|nr:DUF2339 domain-containing protein [Nitrincola sp.]